MKHGRQPIEIPDEERSALALDDADARKAIELAGYRLAMRADAARDLGVGGRRVKPRPLAFTRRRVRKAQQLGMDAILDSSSVLNSYDAFGQHADICAEASSAASATAGSVRNSLRNALADIEAMRRLVRASTLAERGPPSMAACSPKMHRLPEVEELPLDPPPSKS